MNLALSFLAGVFSWTFLEYALHNWNGHKMKGRTSFSRLHLAHHTDPRFFAPASYKLASAVPVVGGSGLLLGWLLGVAAGVSFALGLGSMYLAYEVTHRRTHTHPPRGPWSRWTRKSHLLHHFHSPNTNHGVTSPLWDFVFRTYVRPEKVRVPRRHAPVWLRDPETDQVRAEYSDDYVLVGRAPVEAAAGADRAPLAQPA